MFVCCILHCRGVSRGGSGLSPWTLRVAWIQPDSSATEMKEFIQEPARLEDGGNPTSSQILVVLDGPIGWIDFHPMTVKGHVDAP